MKHKVNRTGEEWISGSLVLDAPLDYNPPFISFEDCSRTDPGYKSNNVWLLAWSHALCHYVVCKIVGTV
jgi:hypothetical protein